MDFRPDAVRGVAAGMSGSVDYRLARRHVINEFKRGRLSRLDICDAHPELLRVADNLGAPTDTMCPICDERPLVHTSFAFGHGLPAHGRVVADDKELVKLARGTDDVVCYVVEVCPTCRWNHLHRVFRVGRKRAATTTSK
jgi:hypothetical protein